MRAKWHGGRRTGGLDQLAGADARRVGFWVDAEPSPEEVAIQAEEFRRLLDGLGDDKLRAIALAKLEGLTDQKIAERIQHSRKWVVRKLAVIRERLKGEPREDVPSELVTGMSGWTDCTIDDRGNSPASALTRVSGPMDI